MWSEEISGAALIQVFPKATYLPCCPTDMIMSIYTNYGVRVHYDRNTRTYSYQIKQVSTMKKVTLYQVSKTDQVV